MQGVEEDMLQTKHILLGIVLFAFPVTPRPPARGLTFFFFFLSFFVSFFDSQHVIWVR